MPVGGPGGAPGGSSPIGHGSISGHPANRRTTVTASRKNCIQSPSVACYRPGRDRAGSLASAGYCRSTPPHDFEISAGPGLANRRRPAGRRIPRHLRAGDAGHVVLGCSMAAAGPCQCLAAPVADRRNTLRQRCLGNVGTRRLSGAVSKRRALPPQAAPAVLVGTCRMERLRRQQLVAAHALAAACGQHARTCRAWRHSSCCRVCCTSISRRR